MRHTNAKPGAVRGGTRAPLQGALDSAKSNLTVPGAQASLRFRRDIEALHRLGPRPIGEFVAELIDRLAGDDPERQAFVAERLSRYARLDGGLVHRGGAHR